MALIKCRECNKEMSGNAKSCPHCGNPNQPETIESTGKKWKGMQLWAILIGVAGIILFVKSDHENTVSAFMIFGGAIGFVLGKVGAWWYHR